MLKENTPTRPRIEPGSPDPESDALTTRPVRSPDNDSGQEGNNNEVIIDMEGVEGDWEPESTQRTHRLPLWMSDYITRF